MFSFFLNSEFEFVWRFSSNLLFLLVSLQPPLQKVSEDPTLPMRQLLSKKVGVPAGESEGLSFAQLRDALLDLNPLDTAHVGVVVYFFL